METEKNRNYEEYFEKIVKYQKAIDKYNKGWDSNNINVVNYWMDYLSYCCLIYHFYLFKLKKIENYWAWLIIVFSALSSTISLLQYNNQNEMFETGVKVTITILTLFATLISAWMKKQNYVEHISELSKYSLKINKLKGDVNSIIRNLLKIGFPMKFTKKHKEDIINCLSVRPLISPMDWKETIYIISKYYPELAAYEYPWKKIPNYGEHAMKTYENMRYSGIWRKIKNGYFLNFCCCFNDSYDKEIASQILRHDKMFYSQLPRDDFDSKKYDCNPLHSYDSFMTVNKVLASEEKKILDEDNTLSESESESNLSNQEHFLEMGVTNQNSREPTMV